MISSMTGFSSHTAILSLKGIEKVSVEVELKSLNSRFFETTCKLPSSLNFLEIPIINSLKKKLIRGRVFLSIKMGGRGDAFEKVVPALKIAKDYLAASNALKEFLKIGGDLTISDIVRLENVFVFEREVIGKSFEKAILQAVDKVTDELIASRRAEGERLEEDLKARLDLASQHIDLIKKVFGQFMKQKKDEINNLILLSEKGDEAATKQLGDAYELLNKIDIHEEIVRFKSHLKNANKVFTSKDAEKGKRFEFILQELSREMNTIAAKCSHFDISSVAVDVKVELEKVREQIQNIV